MTSYNSTVNQGYFDFSVHVPFNIKFEKLSNSKWKTGFSDAIPVVLPDLP